jgi:REP element-mobilizing transposase RayT
MIVAIVMPDHVHLMLSARTDGMGNTYGLCELLSGIKGASAHSVNRALGRKGHVWQDESFDHVIRCDQDIREKAQYICENPVRKGLVDRVEDYPWLWREWVEGRL